MATKFSSFKKVHCLRTCCWQTKSTVRHRRRSRRYSKRCRNTVSPLAAQLIFSTSHFSYWRRKTRWRWKEPIRCRKLNWIVFFASYWSSIQVLAKSNRFSIEQRNHKTTRRRRCSTVKESWRCRPLPGRFQFLTKYDATESHWFWRRIRITNWWRNRQRSLFVSVPVRVGSKH